MRPRRAGFVKASFLTVPVLALSAVAPTLAECLQWSSENVALVGKLEAQTFPGAPNYESVEAGDEPEIHWLLCLEQPICVDGVDDLGFDHPEISVSEVQLLLKPKDYERYRSLLNGEVEVKGKLLSRESGHHHTNVLLEISELRAQDRQ